MYPLARRDKATLAAIGVSLLCVGVVAGRWSKRTETVTVDRVQYVDRERVVYREATASAATSDTHEVVRWKIRTVTEPGKATVVYQEVERGTDSKQSLTSEKNMTSAKDSERFVTEKHSVTIAARPEGWAVAASAGSRWGSWKPIYGGQVMRRILGPITVGVSATTDGGGVLVGVKW